MTADPWTPARHCDCAETEIAAFAAALEGADPPTPVPTCPGWTVEKLTTHLGGVHRWAEGLVRTGARERLSRRDLGVTFPEEPAGLLPWYREGGERLLATLRAADPDAPVWAWGPDRHVRFWSRRLLHETLVHRCDLEMALGRTPAVDPATAVDGIEELLVNLPGAATFSPKIDNLRGDGGTLAFRAADTGNGWIFRTRPDGFEWTRDDAPGGAGGEPGAAVQGDAADVYLFLWGRRRIGDPGLEFHGDEALLTLWTENSAI